MSKYFDQSLKHWQCAAGFPTIKEEVYPEHGLVQEFDEHHNIIALEFGCGGGSDTISFMRRNNHVIACDIVESNLEKAEENIRETGLPMSSVEFCHLECSWEIPIEDNEIDVVSSHGVLHHIAPQEYADKVVKELYRVCKPDGLFYCMLYSEHLREVLDPQVKNFMANNHLSEEEAFGWATDGPGTPYSRFYTEEEGIGYIEQAGFKVVKYTLFNHNQFRTFKAVKP
jgi:ubiquinone/menaquinone biosynthesis C-methylase UbiE